MDNWKNYNFTISLPKTNEPLLKIFWFHYDEKNLRKRVKIVCLLDDYIVYKEQLYVNDMIDYIKRAFK